MFKPQRPQTTRRIFILLCLFCVAVTAEAGEYGMDVFGVSYHPDKTDANGDELHGWNPGLGLQYTWKRNERMVSFINGGVFRNSLGSAALYAGIALQYRFRDFAAGGALTFLHSDTYNYGRPFVAPLPVISYRPVNMLSFHVLYAPKYKDVNENSVVALFVTWHFPR